MSGARPLALGGVVAGAVGCAAAITCLYLPMRHVMVDNGGFCASGGPYQIAPEHQCGTGETWLLMASPILGLALLGLLVAASTAWSGGRISTGGVGTLLWFALFGSLGWNFMDLGLDAPGQQSTSAGWIVCGVMFWVMALGGLVFSVLSLRPYFLPRPDDDRRTGLAPVVRARLPLVAAATSPTAPSTIEVNPTSEASSAATEGAAGGAYLWLLAMVAGSALGIWLGVLIVHAV